MASKYRLQINEWLGERSFGADQVLDVGGGEGSIARMTNLEANRILTLDNNAETKPAFVHDLNEFVHPDELFGSERNPRFDLIFCMNVFEYIWQPYNAIANLYTWLAPGGRLVVNFPFLYPMHNPVGIDYLRYTPEWVQKAFSSKFRFKEVNIHLMQATAGADLLRAFYAAEGMHMRRGDDSWQLIGCIVEAVK